MCETAPVFWKLSANSQWAVIPGAGRPYGGVNIVIYCGQTNWFL
jgi:hypothetical protein